MATQGQRRAEARAAVRRARTSYRRADTSGEKVERELDRLIKRKTLIQTDDLQKLIDLSNQYVENVNSLLAALTLLLRFINSVAP